MHSDILFSSHTFAMLRSLTKLKTLLRSSSDGRISDIFGEYLDDDTVFHVVSGMPDLECLSLGLPSNLTINLLNKLAYTNPLLQTIMIYGTWGFDQLGADPAQPNLSSLKFLRLSEANCFGDSALQLLDDPGHCLMRLQKPAICKTQKYPLMPHLS